MKCPACSGQAVWRIFKEFWSVHLLRQWIKSFSFLRMCRTYELDTRRVSYRDVIPVFQYLRVSNILWIIGKPDICQLFQYMYMRCANVNLRHVPMRYLAFRDPPPPWTMTFWTSCLVCASGTKTLSIQKENILWGNTTHREDSWTRGNCEKKEWSKWMHPTVWITNLQHAERGNSSDLRTVERMVLRRVQKLPLNMKRENLPNLKSITIEKSPKITCATLKDWNLDINITITVNRKRCGQSSVNTMSCVHNKKKPNVM